MYSVSSNKMSMSTRSVNRGLLSMKPWNPVGLTLVLAKSKINKS
jgi:hypothetical protein